MSLNTMPIIYQKIYAYFVHAFTASGVVFGILSLYQTSLGNMGLAFLFMGIAIVIDGVDGTLARRVDIKNLVPIDGALMDNIIDFVTFVIIPCFMILSAPYNFVPESWKIPIVAIIAISSCYQFCRNDAKTEDDFFRGFPSYWNIVVFYLYFWQFSATSGLLILLTFAVMIYIPIKYIYPTKLNGFSHSKIVKSFMIIMLVMWTISVCIMVIWYPHPQPFWQIISIIYIIFYLVMSLYRNFIPLKALKNESIDEK